jgi:hypothetical protein
MRVAQQPQLPLMLAKFHSFKNSASGGHAQISRGGGDAGVTIK